jgi:hypothetical protein
MIDDLQCRHVMVGDPSLWYPINAESDASVHPIYARAAVRTYDVGGVFDDWRVAIDERITALVQALAWRRLLDYRFARRVYRAVRFASRQPARFVDACLWDNNEHEWICGAVVIGAAAATLLLILHPW